MKPRTSTSPGNLTSFKGTVSTFNTDNQVTNMGYGYDGNGNPTTYNAAALTFDPESRLTAYGPAQTDGSTQLLAGLPGQLGGNPF